ncbi:putative glycoside hydrolase [Phaeomoniella chlamydospora]|uniref:Putative glycoside hydrolase n=1 Tax=Phaeomoniella chlamydospora TaxID=158046 RepID=A0A0G2ERX7_PHACM|nr:putative glycoside hydrolase [Phaeomoniella chlamydospora]
MASSVERTASDRERRRAIRRERKAKRLERRAEETASDCERRRADRRERRAKRRAERGFTSSIEINATVPSYSSLDDLQPEGVQQPPTPQNHSDPAFHTIQELNSSPRPTDPYPPSTTGSQSPVKTPYDHLDRYDADYLHKLQPHGYDDRRTRKSSGHPKHKERHSRHDHGDYRHHQNDHRNHHYHDAKHRSHHDRTSRPNSTDQYDTKETYDEYEEHEPRRWSRGKIVLLIAISIILIIIIAFAVAIAVAKKRAFKYTPSYSKVTNHTAFTNGGASKDANNTDDGIGSGTDQYVYYSGAASQFPAKSTWVSFANMWKNNRNGIKNSCQTLGYGKDNTSVLLLLL